MNILINLHNGFNIQPALSLGLICRLQTLHLFNQHLRNKMKPYVRIAKGMLDKLCYFFWLFRLWLWEEDVDELLRGVVHLIFLNQSISNNGIWILIRHLYLFCAIYKIGNRIGFLSHMMAVIGSDWEKYGFNRFKFKSNYFGGEYSRLFGLSKT